MKLNRQEKIRRLQCALTLDQSGGKWICSNMGRLTMIMQITGENRAKIAWAICSRDEEFSIKRGQLIALERFTDGLTMPIELQPGVDYMDENNFRGLVADFSAIVMD